MRQRQAPSSVFMVKPSTFTFNSQTADSNAFQQAVGGDNNAGWLAESEFDEVVKKLRSHQIKVFVFEDTPLPLKPDALFPNNWISTHPSGQVVIYPMMAPNRRLERRWDIVDFLKTHFHVEEVINYSSQEERDIFLEGTGSLVFDHGNRIAYACRSARTNEILLREICDRLGYKSLVFDAVDESGRPVYHTNVMMCVGTKFSVVCLDSIKEEDQELLLAEFAKTSHQVIAISFEQMRSFAGNMIEVENETGDTFILMSQKALDSLLPGQINVISKHGSVLSISIPTIESLGGGSVRCMVGGIHALAQNP